MNYFGEWCSIKLVNCKGACVFMMGMTALITGALFPWWMGVTVFLIGLVIVFRQMNKRPSLLSPKRQIMEEDGSGEWLEEWHDDMRRWQIGPYEWRD